MHTATGTFSELPYSSYCTFQTVSRSLGHASAGSGYTQNIAVLDLVAAAAVVVDTAADAAVDVDAGLVDSVEAVPLQCEEQVVQKPMIVAAVDTVGELLAGAAAVVADTGEVLLAGTVVVAAAAAAAGMSTLIVAGNGVGLVVVVVDKDMVAVAAAVGGGVSEKDAVVVVAHTEHAADMVVAVADPCKQPQVVPDSAAVEFAADTPLYSLLNDHLGEYNPVAALEVVISPVNAY